MDRAVRWRAQLSDLENQYIRLIRKAAASEEFQFWNCYFFSFHPHSESDRRQHEQLRKLEVGICKIRKQLKEAVPGAVIGTVNEAARSISSLGTKLHPGDIIHAVRQAIAKLDGLYRLKPGQP